MRFFDRSCLATAVLAVVGIPLLPRVIHAQGASVSFIGQRVFVTGFTPVIGPGGGVGGIDVDTRGVLQRVENQKSGQLARARRQASQGASEDLRRKSPLRKVSLSRLEAAIARHASQQQPLGAEILFLAGLQRIEYVFVYPEAKDIVIAGPAEDWVLRGGDMVGASSGNAVLRLDDLLDALQASDAAFNGKGITCSIDPSEASMTKFQRLVKERKLQLTETALKEIEQQLGDQTVTITGVRPSSHFARVLVGADYMMKRIAMDLERALVPNLPSYLQLLQRRSRIAQLSAPRWWLSTDYESVQRSEDGLAWRFQGRGVKAESEYGYQNDRGDLVRAGSPSPLSNLWADKFTASYDSLAKQLPVFGQLSGCVDVAVLAALIVQEDLRRRSECPLLLLTDPGKLTGESFAVPQTVPSQARAVRGRSSWIVSVSGGIDLDTGRILKRAETNPKLSSIRQTAFADADPWWWD